MVPVGKARNTLARITIEHSACAVSIQHLLDLVYRIGIAIDVSGQITGKPLFELFDRVIPGSKLSLLFFELLEIIEPCRVDKL